MLISGILGFLGFILVCINLWDGFESLLLPRRVTRRYRLSRIYFQFTWRYWAKCSRKITKNKLRDTFLSVYGPLSMVMLFVVWASGLILGFALLHLGLQSRLNLLQGIPPNLGDYLYLSGVTIFTLGFGDLTPVEPIGRFIAVAESGIGFGFLAAVIGYLPVLYAAFSRRELTISLLDARAGSPPTAVEILKRIGPSKRYDALETYLTEWERWAGEVLESHLSFPVLTYYRSQHDNQSWLAALTAVLDTCAILMSKLGHVGSFQARLTFAMARHAAVDLAQIYQSVPLPIETPRLSEADYLRLDESLRAAGLEPLETEAARVRFDDLRGMYEPFVNALAQYFLLRLPPMIATGQVVDNWQTSAWMRRTCDLNNLASLPDDHDD